jgi:hypothetical protein
MQNLKNFFRLRRIGGYLRTRLPKQLGGYPRTRLPKQRKTGYYYVLWSYRGSTTEGDVWRIGFYLESNNTWSLTGDLRFFKDVDFIAITKKPVNSFPYLLINKVLLIVSCCLIAFSLTMTIINIFHQINHITK